MKAINSVTPFKLYNRDGVQVHNAVSYDAETEIAEINIPQATWDESKNAAIIKLANGKPVWKVVKTIIPKALIVYERN